MNLFDEALIFATEKHSGQVRKMNTAPLILHPMEVAAIVGTMSDDLELLSAAVLHDTVEDADVSLDEIASKFGQRVAYLVSTETENKRRDRPASETWRIRKSESLEVLKNCNDISVKMLWMGDKLSNIRSFYREYNKTGDALWQNLHQKDPVEQEWYYSTVAEYLSDLSGYDAYKEYIRMFNVIFHKTDEVRSK